MTEETGWFGDPLNDSLRYLITGPTQTVDNDNICFLTCYKDMEVIDNTLVYYDKKKDAYIGDGFNIHSSWRIGHSVPENDVPVASISGLKEGVVSPAPENFVAGQKTGNVTPTKAKKKKSSPEKFKIKNIEHGKKNEEHSDFRSSK